MNKIHFLNDLRSAVHAIANSEHAQSFISAHSDHARVELHHDKELICDGCGARFDLDLSEVFHPDQVDPFAAHGKRVYDLPFFCGCGSPLCRFPSPAQLAARAQDGLERGARRAEQEAAHMPDRGFDVEIPIDPLEQARAQHFANTMQRDLEAASALPLGDVGERCDECGVLLSEHEDAGRFDGIIDMRTPEMRFASTPPKTAADYLSDGAATYRERNELYGDSYKSFGKVLEALYPDGFTVSTVDDFNRLGVLTMIISKITRYASNMEKGGHADSALDLMVYAAMLRELTEGEG